MSLIGKLLHVGREARALVDEGVASLPVLGPRLVPAWTIIPAGGALSAESARAPAVLRLPPGAGAFEREIRLPGAGEADIEQAVRLNLERWSPFAPSDTLYAIVPGSVRRTDGVLGFRLALASRSRIDVWVAAAREAGAPRRLAIDVARAGSEAARPLYDLRSGHRPRPAPVTAGEALLALGAIACVAGVAGLASLTVHDRAGGEFAGPVASQAATIDRLKRDAPSSVEALATVAAALPDTSVLEELHFTEEGVLLSGRSDEAASLPVRLEATGAFEQARLEGPLTPDGSGGERFEIRARHAQPGARR